eukprot:s1350_g3.t2
MQALLKAGLKSSLMKAWHSPSSKTLSNLRWHGNGLHACTWTWPTFRGCGITGNLGVQRWQLTYAFPESSLDVTTR